MLSGPEQACFNGYCSGNAACFFQTVAPGSQAAYDLSLGGAADEGTIRNTYGKSYVFCAGNWSLNGTACSQSQDPLSSPEAAPADSAQ